MENTFFVCTIVYSILGSIFYLFVIIFVVAMHFRLKGILKNIEETSRNISTISLTLKEKVDSFEVISFIKSLIEKILSRRKEKDE